MQAAVTNTSSDDLAKLVLRLTLGILLLFHGISKVIGGVSFVTGLVTSMGLPAAFGYLVYVGEVVAPALLLIGLWTRPAALIVVINMLFALLLVHTGQIFTIANTGGWALELQGLYTFGALTVALLGAGRYSAGGINGKWN
jgi:putative oxidoreductase